MNRRTVRRRNGDVPMGLEEVLDPRDGVTMSMAACLNRIMIKVRNAGYSQESMDAVKDDVTYVCVTSLAYVRKKLSFCHVFWKRAMASADVTMEISQITLAVPI